MTLHEILLQSGQVIRRDADVAERSKARGDTIEGTTGGLHLLIQIVTALLDTLLSDVGELILDGLGSDESLDLLDGDVLLTD